MSLRKILISACSMVMATNLYAAEAPPTMTSFNVLCPAKEIAPALDHAYHECSNGFVRNDYDGCGVFLSSFRKLLPEYDCQRPFDATPTKKYVVPAIWLVGDAEFEDYLRLLARMSLGKDKIFAQSSYRNTVSAARELFVSPDFRSVLDGAFAEEYEPLSKQVEAQMLKRKSHPNHSVHPDSAPAAVRR